MNSMVNQMSSWWGGLAKPESDTTETDGSGEGKVVASCEPEGVTVTAVTAADAEQEKQDEEKPTTPPQEEGGAEGPKEQNATAMPIDLDLDEVSAKAITAAKEWGNFIFNVGKNATQQVSEQVTKTAKVIKDTVEEKTIIGDFKREQSRFVTENKDKKKQAEAAVPPWVGYNEEEAMKNQILSLSADRRHLLRNPPAGVQFNFDFESAHPVAMSMLQEDEALKKLRFELVPKQITEENFWRNYFYRVSLIKQSAQLTSLAQKTGSASDSGSRPGSGKGETSQKEPSEEAAKSAKGGPGGEEGSKSPEPEDLPPSSPTDHEFISDSFVAGEISEEDIKKEMQQLGMSDKEEDIPEWERELQAELQDFEVVDDGNNLDDADLEQEILQQLEREQGKEA